MLLKLDGKLYFYFKEALRDPRVKRVQSETMEILENLESPDPEVWLAVTEDLDLPALLGLQVKEDLREMKVNQFQVIEISQVFVHERVLRK